MAEQQRIAVVGAGLAGLAAALELKERGAHVELFERSRLLGGRATSFEIDGIEVDNGQHVFLACCTAFVGFAHRVGMQDRLRVQDRFNALVLSRDGLQGRLVAGSLPAPLHVLASFVRYPHLSLIGKLRIAKVLAGLSLSSIGSRWSDAGNPRSWPRGKNTATFDEWLDKHGQTAETRRAFWNPFFVPALNAPLDHVDKHDALMVLTFAFLRDAGAARFGFSTVPLAHFAGAAAERLDAVHLSTPIASVATTATGVALSPLNGDELAFDAAVLAVPPRALSKLLGDPSRYGVTGLDAFDPYPIVDVHLWHDGGPANFDFAAALDSPLQWIFEKTPGYLCCSFSAADEYMNLPTAELEALAWREVRAFVPKLRDAALVRSAVTRNPEATWLPRAGTVRPAQQTADARLAIAGAWTDTGWPDTMESAVRSGLAAAHALRATT